MDKKHSKLFLVDIDQLFVFKQWYHTTLIRIPTTAKADIIYTLTEE